MARMEEALFDGSSSSDGVSQFPAGLFLFCMIVASIAVITMVVFACGDDGSTGRRERPGFSAAGHGHHLHSHAADHASAAAAAAAAAAASAAAASTVTGSGGGGGGGGC